MRLSLKNLLMSLFGLMVVLAFAQGAVSYWSLRTIREQANEVTTNWMPSLDIVDQFQGLLAEDRLAVEVLNTLDHHRIDDLVVVNAAHVPVGLIDSQDLTKLRLL